MSADIVFESPADRAGFTMMPNIVLHDAAITVGAKVLYGLLLSYARRDGACFPGQSRLAGELGGFTERHVRKLTRELVDQALVRVEVRGHNHTNRYVILALGLREKKRSAGTTVPAPSGSDGNQRSGRMGTSVPVLDGNSGSAKEYAEKKMQKEEDAAARVGGRERTLKFNGKPVNREAWDLTVAVLAKFNELAGTGFRPTTSSGEASEAAKRIYGRVRDWPDITLGGHAQVIERTLASKWWGDSPPTIGVVYGPKVFEENQVRNGKPVRRGRGTSDETTARRMAAVERLTRGK